MKEGVSSTEDVRQVSRVLAHEMVHQWCGNLVTPQWWGDLWLSEGFAAYFSEAGAPWGEVKCTVKYSVNRAKKCVMKCAFFELHFRVHHEVHCEVCNAAHYEVNRMSGYVLRKGVRYGVR